MSGNCQTASLNSAEVSTIALLHRIKLEHFALQSRYVLRVHQHTYSPVQGGPKIPVCFEAIGLYPSQLLE